MKVYMCVCLFMHVYRCVLFMRVYRGVSFIHACVYLCSFMRMFIGVLVAHNLLLMLWRFHKTEITV